MKPIEQNPYRIVGIPSNGTAREMAEKMSKGKLIEIGKHVSFHLDLPGLLAPIERTKAAMDEASKSLTLPAERLRHAMFWFIRPDDTEAYDTLLAGDYDLALEKFGASESWQSRINMSVMLLQNGLFGLAMKAMNDVIENNSQEFVQTVADRTYTCTPDSLRRMYVETLLNEGDDAVQKVLDDNTGEVPNEMIELLVDNYLIDKIEKDIIGVTAVVKPNTSWDAGEQYVQAEKMLDEAVPLLNKLYSFAGNSPRYYSVADKAVNQIIEYVLSYHNFHNEALTLSTEIVARCINILKASKTITVSPMVSERIDRELVTLQKNHDGLSQVQYPQSQCETPWGLIVTVIFIIIYIISSLTNL